MISKELLKKYVYKEIPIGVINPDITDSLKNDRCIAVNRMSLPQYFIFLNTIMTLPKVQTILFFLLMLNSIQSSLFSQTNIDYMNKPETENLKRNINILGSDEYLGRGTGQPGGFKAAAYLAKQFELIGLKSINSSNEYMQNVPFHEIMIQNNSILEINTDSEIIKPELNLEYLVHKSGSSTIIPKPVEMVFVGYGIAAPEYDYNDYRNINVINKVAVMFSGEPASDDESYFYGKLNTEHSQIDIKQRTALAHGAKACLIIPNQDEFSYQDWDNLIYQYSFSELTLAYSPSDIFTILILPEIAAKLFKNEKYDLASLNTMYSENKLRSFYMESTLMFKGVYKDRSFSAPNIIGYLEGSDEKLKNSYVIVTAHYDHLGVGTPVRGDSIYNGVLDNAMGVASLLEIARIIKESNHRPKRTIIFMLTTAEEKGLLGSIHYLNNPVFPLYLTIANINIDGVAFIDNFKSVVGIGSNLSDLDNYLENTALKMNLKIEEFPPEFKELESFSRSDQAAFANAGIPSMLVMDGTDYVSVKRENGLLKLKQYMSEVYHTPFDDFNILINYDAAAQHTLFLLNLITNIADSEKEPEWKSQTQYYYEGMKLKNEKR